MNDLKYLQDLRAAIVNGKFTKSELATLRLDDTNGRSVALNDPGILAVIERRIAAMLAPQ